MHGLSRDMGRPRSFGELTGLISAITKGMGRRAVISCLECVGSAYLIFSVRGVYTGLRSEVSGRGCCFVSGNFLDLFLFSPRASLLRGLMTVRLRRGCKRSLFCCRGGIRISFYLFRRRYTFRISCDVGSTTAHRQRLKTLGTCRGECPKDGLFIVAVSRRRAVRLRSLGVRIVPM